MVAINERWITDKACLMEHFERRECTESVAEEI